MCLSRAQLFLALLAGCTSLDPAAPELVSKLASEPSDAVYLRRVCEVELDSVGMGGTYSAVCIARSGVPAAGRLQLLPQVGGKLLDLAFDGQRISGYFPAAGASLDHPRGTAPPRHLLSFLVASLLEEFTPLTPDRVLGQSGSELHLRGALEGCSVVLELGPDSAVLARRFQLRGVSWREDLEGDWRVFRGAGFTWRMGPASDVILEDVDPGLFRLELTAEGRP